MVHRLALLAAAIAAVTSLVAQLPLRTGVPRLWTDVALAGWALPVAGVKATPKFYTEAEYYAAPVDEVRTYPVYIKSREPEGYRDWMRKQGLQPLIEPAKLRSSGARSATSSGGPCPSTASMRSTRSAGAMAGPGHRTRSRTPAMAYRG